jgi:uncharacterized protein
MPRTSSLRKTVRRLLSVLLLIYISLCAFFYFRQGEMLYPAPTSYSPTTPQDVGIPFEDLHIPVNSTDQIHAWWVPASSPSDKVILAFHGNGYVIEQTANRSGELLPYHETGANLLMVEYRGYGSSSPGMPNESRIYEDARAAFTYLITQRKIPAHNIILLGRSLGTGPATQLAVEHPEAGGLILISAFTSIPAAAKAVWYLRPFPLSILSHSKFDNLSKINSVHLPLLIAVGAEDTLTPPAMAQELIEHANEPKHLYLVPAADHNNLIRVAGEALVSQIGSVIQAIH